MVAAIAALMRLQTWRWVKVKASLPEVRYPKCPGVEYVKCPPNSIARVLPVSTLLSTMICQGLGATIPGHPLGLEIKLSAIPKTRLESLTTIIGKTRRLMTMRIG